MSERAAETNGESGDGENQLGIQHKQDATWPGKTLLKHIRAEILKCPACCTPVEN